MEARDIKFKENPNYKELKNDSKNNTEKVSKMKFKQG